MSLLAVILVLLSAALHAGWNYVGKRTVPSAAFFWIANGVGLLLLLPVAIANHAALPQIPLDVWGLVIATGAFLALYYGSLAAAYHGEDMTIVYPLARSAPVIVVVVTTTVLGRADQLTAACVVGTVLVVGGCFLVPMTRFSDLRWSNYMCPSCGLAFVAACGTAGYSMVDDEALRRLRPIETWESSPIECTLTYAGLQAASCALFLGVFVGLRRRERQRLRVIWRSARVPAIGTGASIVITYSLVLYAMAFAANVSYVVALRQASIPIGVGLGALFLKERVGVPKLTGVVLILAGLTLVAVGG